MELVEKYLKIQISWLIIQIYLQNDGVSLDENIDHWEAIQYLLYWNVIPVNLFEELYALLENDEVILNVHEIHSRLLEMLKNID
ncbi:hypothetical protein MUO14_05415 [Halobacillus shinanisalinarum]|uniref:Uncharacterized protein n=1 Tax=Halobacillus shinanisalinarum TaxID=2932258 RepID=A0ABY4H2N3_9BACI|nr:hypothetical protein [Halobacillus shinanisalinarum]UOQ94395.1 hypothetical protein MUO14_05415 [Halobacillus shinanisalinarum]